MMKGWEWAYRAADIPIHTEEKIIAIVIGDTQVGKSHFIFRFMGFSHENTTKISKAIRISEYGKSDTPFPIVYRTTREQNPLSQNSIHIEDYISKRFKQCRSQKKVECVLNIPVEKKQEMIIVDLVGLNARSEDERQKAIKYSEKWIKKADLLFYLIRAEHMNSFFEEIDESKFLKELFFDWVMFLPQAVFFVFTHAFEQAEKGLKNLLNSHNTPLSIVQEIGKYYKKLFIKESNKRNRSEKLGHYLSKVEIFPVYLGDKKDDRVRKYIELTDHSFYLLNSSLKRSLDNPFFRISKYLKNPRKRTYNLNKRIQEIKHEIDSYNEEKDGIESEMKIYQNILNTLKELRKNTTSNLICEVSKMVFEDIIEEVRDKVISSIENTLEELNDLNSIFEGGYVDNPDELRRFKHLRIIIEGKQPSLKRDKLVDQNKLYSLLKKRLKDYIKNKFHDSDKIKDCDVLYSFAKLTWFNKNSYFFKARVREFVKICNELYKPPEIHVKRNKLWMIPIPFWKYKLETDIEYKELEIIITQGELESEIERFKIELSKKIKKFKIYRKYQISELISECENKVKNLHDKIKKLNNKIQENKLKLKSLEEELNKSLGYRKMLAKAFKNDWNRQIEILNRVATKGNMDEFLKEFIVILEMSFSLNKLVEYIKEE